MARKISSTRSSGSGTLKDGVYQLQIMTSKESVAQSGNDMVTIQLARVVNGKPFGGLIRDHLVFTESAQWKFDNLHEALQIPEGKSFTFEFYKGKRVFASVITEVFKGRIQNKIGQFLTPDEAALILEQQSTDDLPEDEGIDGDESDELEDEDTEDELVPEIPMVPVKTSARTKASGARKRPAELEEEDDMPL